MVSDSTPATTREQLQRHKCGQQAEKCPGDQLVVVIESCPRTSPIVGNRNCPARIALRTVNPLPSAATNPEIAKAAANARTNTAAHCARPRRLRKRLSLSRKRRQKAEGEAYRSGHQNRKAAHPCCRSCPITGRTTAAAFLLRSLHASSDHAPHHKKADACSLPDRGTMSVTAIDLEHGSILEAQRRQVSRPRGSLNPAPEDSASSSNQAQTSAR